MLENIILLATPDAGGVWMENLLLFGGIALVFYFFMIRPQQKSRKIKRTLLLKLKGR